MKSVKRFITLVPLAALLLSACANNRATEVGDPNSDFYLALPRIEMTVDQNGVPSLSNIDPGVIKTLTGGQLDLSAYRMDPAYVQWLTSAGIQHIEAVHKGDGLFLFANNKPLPHIAWNADSINTLGSTTADVGARYGMSGQQAKAIKQLMPFLRRLGIDIAIKLPLAQGATPLALRDAGGKIEAVENKAGDPVAQARVVVVYDADGMASVAGMTAQDVTNLTNVQIPNFDPVLIKTMTELGIQHISMRSDKDGVLLGVNDKPLPSIVWNDQNLANTAELVGALNTYQGMEQINAFVKEFVPRLKDTNLEIALKFPLAPGAQKLNSSVLNLN